MRRFSACAVLALGVVLCGCEDTRTRTVETEVDFRAYVDEDDPQAGVRIQLADTDLGVTDGQGRLRAVVGAGIGSQVAWKAECPPSLTAQPSEGRLAILPFSPLDPTVTRPALGVVVRCERSRHVAAIVVKATVSDEGRPPRPLPDLPLSLAGALAGRTDGHGIAHLESTLAAQESIELRADTTGDATALLRPRNPEVVISGSTRDEVHLIALHFSPARARRPPARAKRYTGHAIRVYQGGDTEPLLKQLRKEQRGEKR